MIVAVSTDNPTLAQQFAALLNDRTVTVITTAGKRITGQPKVQTHAPVDYLTLSMSSTGWKPERINWSDIATLTFPDDAA